MSDPSNSIIWPRKKKVPKAYESCFWSALRRMAIALNSQGDYSVCPRTWRTLSDIDVEHKFRTRRLDQLLVRLMHLSIDKSASEDEVAENYFYGWFDFSRRTTPRKHVLIRYTTTDPFLSWSYQGMHWPDSDNGDLDTKEFATTDEFMRACSTNYLLKNFWHNFVHAELQDITHDNYHKFGGNARFESDFEADNLANIFLVSSYGLPVKGAGRLSAQKGDRIRLLLRRNRCNRVFALRAAARIADASRRSQAEQWEEREWRYRRGLSNQISGLLLAAGCTVTTLGVYLTGPICRGRDGFYRKGKVVVSVNGLRVPTDVPPYVPAKTPKANFDRNRRENYTRVAFEVYNKYKAKLEEDLRFREFCQTALVRLFERSGVSAA